MAFVKNVKGFMQSPTKSFEAARKASLGDAFKYYLVLLIISSVLAGAVAAVFSTYLSPLPTSATPFGVAGLIVGLFVLNIVVLFVFGAWLHIWAYLLDARKGFAQTLKALMYGFTPSGVLGWIPYINIPAAVWTLILYIVGLKILHNTTYGRAVAAFLIAFIIVLVVVAVIAVIFIVALLGSGLIPGASLPGISGLTY